jgi:hypothetical protein
MSFAIASVNALTTVANHLPGVGSALAARSVAAAAPASSSPSALGAEVSALAALSFSTRTVACQAARVSAGSSMATEAANTVTPADGGR